MTKLEFLLRKLSSQLWVRPAIFSLAAVGWVVLSFFADRLFGELRNINIEKETLINLFSILASTMLTVATFSVSAISTAFASVATSATPRATSIVMGDARIQSTLAAFLAAFIYAVVSITFLSAVNFGTSGRFVLFCGFTLLVGWVLMSFLGWVDRVSRLGRLNDTLTRVFEKARTAFSDPEIAGYYGGKGFTKGQLPGNSTVIRYDCFGYVQHLDMKTLQGIAEEHDGRLWLDVRPGTFVTSESPVAWFSASKSPDEETLDKIRRALTVGREREYQTDPRFSMILLAEISDRALSPAVNDPGTAIEVLAVQLELFYDWADIKESHRSEDDVKYDRIYVPEITAEDLIFDAFTPIARDGAGMIEVGIRLQKALRSLMHHSHAPLREAAGRFRHIALELADRALPLESQRKILHDLARRPLDN